MSNGSKKCMQNLGWKIEREGNLDKWQAYVMWRQEVSLKHWHPSNRLHGITSQKTILFLTTIKSSDFCLNLSRHSYIESFIFSGFLAQYVMGRPLETCIRCGIWVATEIIQRPGCTYDGLATFSE
jgi:hypothetical protein